MNRRKKGDNSRRTVVFTTQVRVCSIECPFSAGPIFTTDHVSSMDLNNCDELKSPEIAEKCDVTNYCFSLVLVRDKESRKLYIFLDSISEMRIMNTTVVGTCSSFIRENGIFKRKQKKIVSSIFDTAHTY
jgi:hypothetical protein